MMCAYDIYVRSLTAAGKAVVFIVRLESERYVRRSLTAVAECCVVFMVRSESDRLPLQCVTSLNSLHLKYWGAYCIHGPCLSCVTPVHVIVFLLDNEHIDHQGSGIDNSVWN